MLVVAVVIVFQIGISNTLVWGEGGASSIGRLGQLCVWYWSGGSSSVCMQVGRWVRDLVVKILLYRCIMWTSFYEEGLQLGF